MLCEARRTFTGEASQGVDAEELAVVLLGLTFIKVSARLAVLLQNVAPRAGTLVAALRVLADEVARLWGLGAFIEVYAGGSANVCGVASLAEASEGAHGVDALAVGAEVWHHLAFINISPISGVPWTVRTDLFVLGSRGERAELALVAPASPAVAAAFRLGDQVAAAGRHLAHGLQHLGEAQALPVVKAFSARGA